jgi:Na+-translocating ferredoxin:NAD+ oxidoreductase RnfD subunit
MPVNHVAVRGRPPERTPLQTLYRFVRTPKGTLLWILLVYVALALIGGRQHPLPDVIAAVVGAVAAEMAMSRLRDRRFAFPSGALITALIVSLVLAWQTPAYVPLLTGVAAVVGKHVIRTRWSNVFNPAVLALIASALVFHGAQSWWGAVPLPGFLGLLVLVAGGWYLAAKVDKLALSCAFLTTALLGFTIASLLGATSQVAQVYRTPDIQALLFFAAFMLTDPPTSPARQGDQVWFGAVAGAASVAIFLMLGVQWFVIAGLPLGNALESLRRLAARRHVPAAGLAAAAAGGQGMAGAARR